MITRHMSLLTENPADTIVDPGTGLEALYRQGMAYYRARQWGQARECFLRLRALDPERRDIDGLIDELDHFIRLEEVRPGIAVAARITADTAKVGEGRAAQRAWLWLVPALALVILVLGTVFVQAGIFAQGSPPTPSPAPTAVLISAKVMGGQPRIQPSGADIWQEWTNGRLLHSGDRITAISEAAIEFSLLDGKATIILLPEASLAIGHLAPDGQVAIEHTSGRLHIQTNSLLISITTPFLTARPVVGGSAFRIDTSLTASTIATDVGQVSALTDGQAITIVAGQQVRVRPGEVPAVEPQATLTATPTGTTTTTPTLTPSPTTVASPTVTVTNTPTAIPPIATPAPAPTRTPIPMMATPTIIATPTPLQPAAPTAPVVAPTQPPAPPTNTPIPPTNTPVPPPTATPKR